MEKRYFISNTETHPELKLDALSAMTHALFCQWVRRNYFVRDFSQAVRHEVHLCLAVYFMDGQPALDAVEIPSFEHLYAESSAADPEHTKPHRFYADEGGLNIQVKTDFIRKHLAAFFVNWVADGWFARDFIHAVQNCAEAVEYDYDIVSSLNGLGGGRTLAEFLAKPVKKHG